MKPINCVGNASTSTAVVGWTFGCASPRSVVAKANPAPLAGLKRQIMSGALMQALGLK